MKVIGYVRVSTAGQAEEGVSMEAQAAKIRAWAELNDAAEVQMFMDAGVSGKRADNRPGLQSALAALKAGDALVIYSLSRLSRSTKDTLELAERLAKQGADLVSLSEKVDTTSAAGKMIFRILSVMSEFERDQISDRTKFALAHKRALGEKTGGEVPYGYRADEGGLLVVDEAEAALVNRIAGMSASGTMSLSGIARTLEAEGVERRGRAKWHPQTVKNIILAKASQAAG